MKEKLLKYKEIFITIIIIGIVVGVIIVNFYKNYQKNYHFQEKLVSNESKNQYQMAENDYFIKEGKLFISYDGDTMIEVPGDFASIENNEAFPEGTYQISQEKTIFYYTMEENGYFLYSDDAGKNWNTVCFPKEGNIKDLQFIDKENGFFLTIKDVAMTEAKGAIYRTTDGGKTWEEMGTGIEDVFKMDSQIRFFTNALGYLTMPYNGGNACDLYMTIDGGKTFTKVQVNYVPLPDTNLDWTDIYDTYYLPTKQGNTYYLKIGQGLDGDYNGGNSKEYFSNDGFYWSSDEIQKMALDNARAVFNQRVANRSDTIFLKDFQQYRPESTEIKVTQEEAEEIANIGFVEAGTIGETGDEENQTFTIEEVYANNFFTMDYNCINEVYQNILRKCYVFSRENALGNGSKIYIDVTTGLIIGGECFGD